MTEARRPRFLADINSAIDETNNALCTLRAATDGSEVDEDITTLLDGVLVALLWAKEKVTR